MGITLFLFEVRGFGMKKEKDLSRKNKEIHEVKSLNPMIILAVIIVLAAIATYIVPAGAFDRTPWRARSTKW